MSNLVIEASILDTVVLTKMMPELTDKQVCKIFKKTAWRTELWDAAKAELQKRRISPLMIKQILKEAHP